MSLEVTLIYTILLIVFLLILTIRVLDLRGSPVTKFLHAPDRVVNPETLERAIRAHGNLIEYAPLFLILMLLLELTGASETFLYICGTVFTVGRFMHGIAFSFMKKNGLLRIGGMTLTFLGLIGLIISAFLKILS